MHSLLRNTVAQDVPNQDNGILKNGKISVPLKCLSIFGDHSKCH